MSILELTGAESCKECGERAQADRDRLQTENDLLVMKLNAEHIVRQNVERENAKLREQIHWLKQGDILHVLTDQEYIDQCERERLMQVSIDALDKENAKLRELAEMAWKSAERLCQAFDGPCSDDGVTIAKPCPMGERDDECVYGQLQRELRELGVEVDG